MGYTTTFDGHVTVDPPLSAEEAKFLKRFAEARHCAHQLSKWAATGNYDCPPYGQRAVVPGQPDGSCYTHHRENPGYWCQWVPGGEQPDGTFTTIEWNGMEKFYDADKWMQFLIDEFLKPNAGVFTNFIPIVNGVGVTDAHIKMDMRGHTLNGVINAEGEEAGDIWRLVVRDNVVTVEEPQVLWPSDSDEPVVIPGTVIKGEICG